jgi:hypothetical protein
MKFPWSHDEGPPEPTGYVGDHADKLGRISGLSLDDEERPSREDADYGQTLFTRAGRPVPLPRFMTPRRKRPPRR